MIQALVALRIFPLLLRMLGITLVQTIELTYYFVVMNRVLMIAAARGTDHCVFGRGELSAVAVNSASGEGCL